MPTTAAASPETRITLAAPGLWAMIAIHACALLAVLPAAAPTPRILWLTAGAFVARNFCVSIGYHRYFSHRAFRTSRAVQFALALVGGMAVMRSALWWASQHRQHHVCSDREGDPHAPWRGFLWCHMTWFTTVANQPTRLRLVRDFARFPELRWLDRHEWAPVLAFVAASWAAGGFAGFVWIANVGSVALCHVTFTLNSVTHQIGRRRYDTRDTSRNLLPIALLTFGEGWHNNHHRWPGRARLGEGWREPDISWWAIRALERLGLVWGVRR